MNEETPKLPPKLQLQIIKPKPYFGKMVGLDNWIMFKSCFHDFCIRQHEQEHCCWGGGRYTN